MKKIFSFFLAVASIFIFASCSNKKLQIKDVAIESESEFGGIYIKYTIDDFNKLGFEYGDSVDIKFSNGYELLDQPYYNGYYVDAGKSLLVGYPGYPYIKATLNYGDDLWQIGNLKDDDTATVTLKKKKKYLDIQKASDIHYYDEREKYETDEEFANFRNIKVGNIKEGILYRSASPCDNKHKRAHYTDTLMEKANVNFILNLADTDEKIKGYMEQDDFDSPYFKELYTKKRLFLSFAKDDKVMPLALNMNYMSDEFGQKVAMGFKNMASSNGPYLVHCLEGKDRTGFVCIVLEALMGASYKEIVDDYMLTYKNYYGIIKGDSRYDVIKKRNVDSMLEFICNGDPNKVDIVSGTKNYLLKMGMTSSEIETLVAKLK